jgi:hypothetical protein
MFLHTAIVRIGSLILKVSGGIQQCLGKEEERKKERKRERKRKKKQKKKKMNE